MMTTFNHLMNKADKLNRVSNAEVDAFDFADRNLLDLSAIFFELLFSQLLSFQWLTYFLSHVPGKTHELSLPYLDKNFSIRRVPGSNLKNSFRFGTYYYYYSDKIRYAFKAVETPFVILHWIGSHLGKVVGWLVASPFAAVGYAVKKIYYGIQKAFYNRQLQRESLKLDPIEFAEKWIFDDNSYLINVYITKLLGQLPPRLVLDGIFSKSNIDTPLVMRHFFSSYKQNYMDYLCQPNSVNSNQSLLEARWEKYHIARINYFEEERKWSLAKTVLSGFLLFPLLRTIPQHKKLVLNQDAEKAALHKIADDIAEKKDPRLFGGQLYLSEGNYEKGLHVLKSIPHHNIMYSQATSDIGYHTLAHGNANEAAHYFAESKEERAHQVAKTLAQQPHASLSDLVKENQTLMTSAGVLKNNNLFTQPLVPALAASNVNEVKSLDEEDGLNMGLVRGYN